MNNTHFGATHYEIHLDMKLDYTISRIFQERSLTEVETLHQLCELERTQVQHLYVFEEKTCYKRIPIFYKNKVHFLIHSPAELISGI